METLDYLRENPGRPPTNRFGTVLNKVCELSELATAWQIAKKDWSEEEARKAIEGLGLKPRSSADDLRAYLEGLPLKALFKLRKLLAVARQESYDPELYNARVPDIQKATVDLLCQVEFLYDHLHQGHAMSTRVGIDLEADW